MAGRRMGLTPYAFPVTPSIVRDCSDSEAWLRGFTAVPEDASQATDTERLFMLLGCGSERMRASSAYDTRAAVPTAEETARLDAAAVARVCRLLTHGLIHERFNAAFVLGAQLLLPVSARAPAFNEPATLDALCVAAVSNAYVPQPADDPLAERTEIAPPQLRHVLHRLDLLPDERASDVTTCVVALAMLRVLALHAVAHAIASLVSLDYSRGLSALRRALKLGFGDAALLFASEEVWAPDGSGGLCPEAVAALRVRGRATALNALGAVAPLLLRLDPPPKDVPRVLAAALDAAIAALNPRRGAHPRVRGAAAWLLSYVVTPPPAKLKALRAGVLP